MKRKEGFILRTICGEKVIVGEGLGAINFGKLISLNNTATWVWEEAGRQGEFTAGSIADALCEKYEVSHEKALADVDKIFKQWQELGIVE